MLNGLSFLDLKGLSFLHVGLILLSNVLVQYPFQLFGLHTTWGAFSYPLIFILTDLTTRIYGGALARKVVFVSMLPGLLLSYLISSYFDATASMSSLHIIPLRIACACFLAYVVGQLLDILVFQKFRENASWWVAPSISTIVGNFVDTILFFSVAFYDCSNPFLSAHWPEIALVDMSFKVLLSLFAFVPVYGIVLNGLLRRAAF